MMRAHSFPKPHAVSFLAGYEVEPAPSTVHIAPLHLERIAAVLENKTRIIITL